MMIPGARLVMLGAVLAVSCPSVHAFLLPVAVAPRPMTATCAATEKRTAVVATRRRPPSCFRVQAEASDDVGSGPPPPPPASDVFEAIMAGDMAGVDEYVRAGGDCSVRDSIGDTPLMLAVEGEMSAAVSALTKLGGANANDASETTGETPLQLAAYYGYTNLARVLVNECGANLETRNKKGETALNLACFWGNTDTVEFLLEAGADPNNTTDGGDLPGDQFDSVFVPFAPSRVDGGGDGGEEEEEGPRGPREDIIALLENARAAKQGAPVAANGA